MKKTKPNLSYKTIRVIGYASPGITGLIACASIFPSTFLPADAIDNTSTYTESRISVRATASLSISVDSQVNIELTPNSNGAFGYNSAKLNVSTNNEEGYQLFLTTSNGNNTLKNTDITKTGNNHEITSIANDTKGTNFTGNTWGYSLSKTSINENSTYKSVPTSATSIYTATSAPTTETDTYNLGFGTHISPSLASGEYSNSVIVSAIANPIVINTLSQLVYMQDMTPEICANTAYADGSTANEQYKLNPVTKQLYDIRDGKQYWVAKLADGNCWMTQNLAINLSTNKTLTPSDTDITTNWTPPFNTNTTTITPDSNAPALYQSWNIGQVVISNPSTGRNCPAASNSSELVSQCASHLKKVDGWTTGFTATDNSSINESTKTYDAHYLLGNYYQWNAATAGTGPLTDSINPTASAVGADGNKLINASGSICPKGWRLPADGRQLNQKTGLLFNSEDSFYRLFHAYGAPDNTKISTTENTGYWLLKNNGSVTTSTSFLSTKKKPIYLIIGGLLEGSNLRSVTWEGFYYSGTASPINGQAYSAAFGTYTSGDSIAPGGEAFRQWGLQIRCLAR